MPPTSNNRRALPKWAVALILLLLVAGFGLQVSGKLLVGNDHPHYRAYIISGVGLHLIAAGILLVVLWSAPKEGPAK
jgi:hypothetical protein